MSCALFGISSKPSLFLLEKIQESPLGPYESTTQDESQIVMLLGMMASEELREKFPGN
jgi:hypothetical protein